MAPLNLTRLQELFEEGGDNPEIIAYWYEQLSEYEPEGSESPRSVETVMRAMKWIMQYEHANTEELKEMAEKEAAEMAEKQENWDEERENMKQDLNALRERIISTANATDLNEAFRAQISSLQEENAYLKSQNRERDRELAAQSDKAERFSSRIEQLEKERAALVQQQAFSDDAIRELNRRLDNKSEASATTEAEAAKLRQRSQQAAQLSRQLQEVVQQNDELRTEVEQLSSALTSATTFIEDTTENYTALREQLLESDKIIERLTNDNEVLTKKLGDERAAASKLESAGENSIQYYKDLLQDKDEQIEALQHRFETLQVELQELQAQSMLENNVEQEEEMKRLRTELVEATKVARRLFSATAEGTVDDSTAQMQRKVMQLKETVDALQSQIKQQEMQNMELARNLEVKDAENLKVNAELKRMRVAVFGSAEIEISRLEKQLRFREQQIEKLTAKCSLLQGELSNADVFRHKPEISISATDSAQQPTILKRELELDEKGTIPKKLAKQDAKLMREEREPGIEIRSKADKETLRIQKKPKQYGLKKEEKEEEHEGSLESWEASAMIISSLNHELMLLMQELDEKDRQLRRMEKSSQQAVNSIDELKVRYFNLQKKASEYDSTQHTKTIDELREKIERYEIEIEEYQKLSDSMRLSGNNAERKLEEMNRQVIAERLRNLQLVRKLQIVERNRNEQNAEYNKLEKSCQEQKLLYAKQLKISGYESDLATIEIARLQTVLLHSVPRKDYDELLAQHKQLLASDDGYKTHFFKSDETDKEYVGINLLKEMADETRTAELTAENTHLKEMINVLTSQSEYWRSELEKIREQNTEMTQFLEDVESESQVKSLLVALERRFLKALSERAQVSQNQTFTSHQFLDLQNEFTRKRREWVSEKKKLVQVIRSLQMLLQRIRSNSMELITVQQMLNYKEKVAEASANYAKSQKLKEEIERQKEELDLQLRNAEALRKSYELLQENGYNVIKLQKSLQANQLNVLNTAKQLENAELQIQKKDAQIQILEERIKSLQSEIEDLFAATFKISDSDEESEKIDQRAGRVAKIPSTEMHEQPESPESKPKLDVREKNDYGKTNLEREDSENMRTNETPTETFDSASDAKLHATVKVQVIDSAHNLAKITEEYEKKLNYIRETAELCIDNYKEQLKYKNEVIEKYKVFLRSMQKETDAERKESSFVIAEDSERKKLRTSSEILSQIQDTDIEAKDLEILKLRNEIEQFTKANRRLNDELEELRTERNHTDAAVQTVVFLKEERGEEIPDERSIPSSESYHPKATREESRKTTTSPEPKGIQTPPPSRPTRTIPLELADMSDDVLIEALRREESTTMTMRMEIRKLKQRIATLNAKNQELEKACETIRDEALSQIERSYAPNNYAESEATITKLQQELSALRKEAANQKGLIREQKEIIDQLQDAQKTQSVKNAQVEVAKWHEKKTREGNIDLLRKKLRETEQHEQEMREKLEKRDRRIEQLNRSESTRSAELARLQSTIKKLTKDKEVYILQGNVANDRLKTSEEMNAYLNHKIAQLRKENDQLLANISKKKAAVKSDERNKAAKLSTTKVNTIIVQNVPEEELRELRGKAEQFDDLMRKLRRLEEEVEECREENRALNDRLHERRYDCGAVSVLRDKLIAKEKLIVRQQQRIEELEREKWQNLL